MNYETFKLLCDGCDPEYKITLSIKELKTIINKAELIGSKGQKVLHTIDPRLFELSSKYEYNRICNNRHRYIIEHFSEDVINKMKINSMRKLLIDSDISVKLLNILIDYEYFMGDVASSLVKLNGNWEDFQLINSILVKSGRSVWEVINDPLYIWPEKLKLPGMGKLAINELKNLQLSNLKICLKDLPIAY